MRTMVGLLIAVFFIWLVVRQVDGREVSDALQQTNPYWLALAVLILLADYLVRTYRWLLLLRCFNPGLSFKQCLAPFWGGFAMNNVLPLRAGDILRVLAYRQHLSIERTHIASTLLIERVYDLTALLVALSIALLVFPLNGNGLQLKQMAMLALLLALLAAAVTIFFPARVQRLCNTLGSKLQVRPATVRLNELTDKLFSGLVNINSGTSRSSLLIITAIAWCLEGLLFACVLFSLNITPALAAGWLAMAAGTLATLIPSSPGYAGTFDYFTSMSLQVFDVSATHSVVAALIIHLTLWLPITIVGGCLLWYTHGYQTYQAEKFKSDMHGT